MCISITINSFEHNCNQNDLLDVCLSQCSRICQNVVLEQQDVIPDQQNRSKCRFGTAGQVEMSSQSNRTVTGRNVVLRRKTPKDRTEDGEGQEWKVGRNVAPEQQDRSKCLRAARQVEMSSWSSKTGRNVVPEQPDRSKCRPRAAGQVEMSFWSSRTSRNVVPEQVDRSKGRGKVPEAHFPCKKTRNSQKRGINKLTMNSYGKK